MKPIERRISAGLRQRELAAVSHPTCHHEKFRFTSSIAHNYHQTVSTYVTLAVSNHFDRIRALYVLLVVRAAYGA